ncbi:extracellular solute-binding protein [Cellulomonas sp. ATA003]|uniref:ABC transporter substrate-binding protein n=1 Tax=Cellulomonas sp. ATA003 TaxID=3073064 RepID=UPI0028730A1B|nr:extracellular solute-binding protein [Cellulomonas sp. ATA003]WNB85841.1 extracellular solute-binding protein [Cellulomonas sp. ATA003]
MRIPRPVTRSRSGRPHRPLVTTVTLVAAGSLVLTACGQGEDPGTATDDDPAAAGGDVELRFTWWGADARAEITEEVIDMFEAENPGVTVVPEWSTWDGYWDKLATGAAAGDMPDVVQMDESQINAYGTQGSLLDLESQPDALDVSTIEPEVLLTGEVDGTIVGAPVGIAIYSVGVNPTILERAGLEMPDDTTWTWDDFVEMSAQVTEALGDEGITGMDFFGMDSAEVAAYARQNGEQVFPREGEEPVSEETLTEFYALAKRMEETGATPQPSLQTETIVTSIEQSPFGTNTSAFHLQFHTQIQAFVDASGTELQLLRLPSVEPGEPQMVNKASMYWSIASTTEHPAEAAALVDFMLNDEEAALVLGVERGVPGIPAIQEVIRPQLSPTGVMALDFASTMQEEVVDPPQVTPSSAATFDAEVGRIGSEVLFGSMTPEQAAQATLDVIAGYEG